MAFPFNTTSTKNTYMLFTGWEVHIGKNCDWGLNMLTEAYDNFGKSLAIFRIFWKSSETVQKCFPSFLWFFKIFGNLQKRSEIYGNFRKIFGNGSEVIFRCFYDFLKFLENLRKCSENFGNSSKVIFRCFYYFLIFLKMAPRYKPPVFSPRL